MSEMSECFGETGREAPGDFLDAPMDALTDYLVAALDAALNQMHDDSDQAVTYH